MKITASYSFARATTTFLSSTALLVTLLLNFSQPQHLYVAQAFVVVPSSSSSTTSTTTTTIGTTSSSLVVSRPSSLMQQQQQQQQQRPHLFAFSLHPRNSNNKNNNMHVLYMGSSWGPDPIWSTAIVLSNVDACPSGKSCLLQVQVPMETAAEYKVPGQYIQMRPSNDDTTTKPLFLAMASPPSATAVAAAESGDENQNNNNNSSSSSNNNNNAVVFEFLIKKTDGNAWLTTLPTGTAVQISQILGNGYALQENLEGFKYDFPTQNILLLAAGSGIAPLKAAIESNQLFLKEGSREISGGTRTCRLYYGEQTANDLCFTNQFATWEQMGVQVVPVLSQPEPDWQGRQGYVQTALEEDGVAVPRNTGVLICGMKGMAEASKELLTNAGVFEGRILFNF